MDITNLVLAILGIGLLVAFHEAGHHLVALWCGMRVRRFSVGFGPAILKTTHNGIDYTVGALPLGGFVDIVGMNPMEEGADEDPQSFQNRPRWARALVVAAGPAFNYVLAFFVFAALFWFGGMKQDLNFLVTEVIAGGAAEAAGVKAGDVVLTVAGRTLHQDAELLDTVGAHAGRPLELKIRRGDGEITISPVPQGDPARLNIRFDLQRVGEPTNYGLGEAVQKAGQATVSVSLGILSQVGGLLKRVVEPGESALEQLRGPPEIVKQLKSAATRSLKEFFFMFAVLSVMLGLFNLFPIPPLDGSKLIFIGAEAVARRAIPARAQIYIHGVGFIFMFGLMLVVSVKDVLRKDPVDEKVAPVEQKADPAPAPAPEPAPATP